VIFGRTPLHPVHSVNPAGARPSPPPRWAVAVDPLLVRAARDVQPLAAMTPLDAHAERERLAADLRARRPALPRWTYARRDHEALRRALDAAEWMLAREREHPLDRLYCARLRELSLEASLCEAAGTTAVARLATERYAHGTTEVTRAASALCAAWLDEAPCALTEGERRTMRSDDPRPASLLSRMRATVGRLRLPFAVVATPALASLAATGENAIFVASGRDVCEEDAERTVLHEVDGHARPRARSSHAELALLRAGTARGVDHQEGRALVLEQRAGYFGARRKRQLAARHRAVEAMLDGATFSDVARRLVDAHGVDELDAVIVAERAFRGGDGVRPGLGRERVYLESFVRVTRHLEEHPDDDAVLSYGQIAIDAIDVLRPYVVADPADYGTSCTGTVTQLAPPRSSWTTRKM
jgi:hypothetical protein